MLHSLLHAFSSSRLQALASERPFELRLSLHLAELSQDMCARLPAAEECYLLALLLPEELGSEQWSDCSDLEARGATLVGCSSASPVRQFSCLWEEVLTAGLESPGAGLRLALCLMSEDPASGAHVSLGQTEVPLSTLVVNRSQRLRRALETSSGAREGALLFSLVLEKRERFVRILGTDESAALSGIGRATLKRAEEELAESQASEPVRVALLGSPLLFDEPSPPRHLLRDLLCDVQELLAQEPRYPYTHTQPRLPLISATHIDLRSPSPAGGERVAPIEGFVLRLSAASGLTVLRMPSRLMLWKWAAVIRSHLAATFGETPELRDVLSLERDGAASRVVCSLSPKAPRRLVCRAADSDALELDLELASLDSLDVSCDHPSVGNSSLVVNLVAASLNPANSSNRSSLQSPLKVLRGEDSISTFLILRCGASVRRTPARLGAKASWAQGESSAAEPGTSIAVYSPSLELFLFSDGLTSFHEELAGYVYIPSETLTPPVQVPHANEPHTSFDTTHSLRSSFTLTIFVDRCTDLRALPPDAREVYVRCTVCRWSEGNLDELGVVKSRKVAASRSPVWEESFSLSSSDFELYSADFVMLEVTSKGSYGKASLGQTFLRTDEFPGEMAQRSCPLQFFKDPSLRDVGRLLLRLQRTCGDLTSSTVELRTTVVPTNPYTTVWPCDVIISSHLEGEDDSMTEAPFVLGPMFDGLALFDRSFSASDKHRRRTSDPKGRKFDLSVGSQGADFVQTFENQRRSRFPPYHFSSKFLKSSDPRKFSDEVSVLQIPSCFDHSAGRAA